MNQPAASKAIKPISRAEVALIVRAMIALTVMEIALYHSLDFVYRAFGDTAMILVLLSALVGFDVLAAVYVARSFAAHRLWYGLEVATLVWGTQLPVLIVLIWIAEGPPVIAADSLWNVGVFGWWYTGLVSVPLIGLLTPGAGWILDKRKMANASAQASSS